MRLESRAPSVGDIGEGRPEDIVTEERNEGRRIRETTRTGIHSHLILFLVYHGKLILRKSG